MELWLLRTRTAKTEPGLNARNKGITQAAVEKHECFSCFWVLAACHKTTVVVIGLNVAILFRLSDFDSMQVLLFQHLDNGYHRAYPSMPASYGRSSSITLEALGGSDEEMYLGIRCRIRALVLRPRAHQR
jgi:hypothetical protein